MTINTQELVHRLLDISHERKVKVTIQASELDEFIYHVYAKYNVTKLYVGYDRNADEYTVVVKLWA